MEKREKIKLTFGKLGIEKYTDTYPLNGYDIGEGNRVILVTKIENEDDKEIKKEVEVHVNSEFQLELKKYINNEDTESYQLLDEETLESHDKFFSFVINELNDL